MADGWESITFTVDSALLRELGERLVGQKHIALAELVKNSYDADAHCVSICFGEDRIEVVDNGHGMDLEEFKSLWMRVGSPHKEQQEKSRHLNRPLTGSKGIGRLSVQFLAREVELKTVSREKPHQQIRAKVNWDEAVEAPGQDLTKAEALYQVGASDCTFAKGYSWGTSVSLTRLVHEWHVEDIVNLAKEIWWLQPPFDVRREIKVEPSAAFEVDLQSPDPKAVEEFKGQMSAYLELWRARVIGELTDEFRKQEEGVLPARRVALKLEYRDDPEPVLEDFWIEQCRLDQVEFEIRIYKLEHRQKHGIKVATAREYFNEYGGVHIYDSDFHLPYYGAKNDWLGIEMDHSHRLSRSKLLPGSLQVPEGMNYLPTNSRLMGVVQVSTGHERRFAQSLSEDELQNELLQIQISRDRLVANKAYEQLTEIVRWPLDFYAMQTAKRKLVEAVAKKPEEPPKVKLERIEQVLKRHAESIPEPAYQQLRIDIGEAIEASESEAEIMARQTGLLGALATAGISAIAYEHEAQKQYQHLEGLSRRLREMAKTIAAGAGEELAAIADDLEKWLERGRATRSLFVSLMDEENRDLKARFKAGQLVQDVASQIAPLLPGIEVETQGIDEKLRLPEGRFSEWSALLQNLFINAANAMLDSTRRLISVESRSRGDSRALVVQDTGSGVNLKTAEELFEPFVRRLEISSARRALGMGGMGLGLTIVRMIADTLDCRVQFIEPGVDFSTAAEIRWMEI